MFELYDLARTLRAEYPGRFDGPRTNVDSVAKVMVLIAAAAGDAAVAKGGYLRDQFMADAQVAMRAALEGLV